MELDAWSGWLWLAILPVLLGSTTSLAKASVVLGAVRVGLGAEGLLTRPVVWVLAGLVTALVMAPTVVAIGERWSFVEASALNTDTLRELLEPLRAFVVRHADAAELEFFSHLQKRPIDDPLVEVSAFLVTELNEALVMAVVILVPLVLVDLLVAQALLLLGLSHQPPAVIVMPLKLLLFLAVGGWDVVIGGLVEGYA